MKRYFAYFLLACISGLTFTACERNNEPEETEFPKKNLIEEFTGQTCGYCPYGMDCIHSFIGNDSNWIVILHHYGYQVDKFSVSGSKTITSALKVSGAPSMAINRTQVNYGDGKGTVFHPAYLPETNKAQFETTTYASLNIANTYDASSRELKVHISGKIKKEDYPNLFLTVLVKESGMINTQADYYNTYEGWEEFRHTNAVRAFLSEAKGDAITVNKEKYSADYSLTLKEEWVPENCMVVAFISEEFKPVVQAEQRPVVPETKGGADILHGGIKAVPVSDFYPEPDAAKGPSDYSGEEADTLRSAQAMYMTYSDLGINYWEIYATNADDVITVDKTKCVRYAVLCLFTTPSETDIPAGTYELNLSEQPGTAYAGFRDDEEVYIGGSTLYYTSQSYFNQGYLVPSAQWLIADGTLTITAEGWEVVGHARNGAPIHMIGKTPIVNKGRASAPAKAPKKFPRQAVFCQ
ncbi:MAG: Omp28-related outer membrane protein [Paludibacteraceae bacterium]|nr:Omp28-related outer membrane protein [Paludibacteraceae bacterium]